MVPSKPNLFQHLYARVEIKTGQESHRTEWAITPILARPLYYIQPGPPSHYWVVQWFQGVMAFVIAILLHATTKILSSVHPSNCIQLHSVKLNPRSQTFKKLQTQLIFNFMPVWPDGIFYTNMTHLVCSDPTLDNGKLIINKEVI